MTILVPEILESLQKSEHFPTNRHRWNTNEEIAALLISWDHHEKWLSEEVKLSEDVFARIVCDCDSTLE
ncbi:calmodulin-binding transcription activator (camta)-like protein [Sarcoptes scabiei]|uniref:Calmodulin-binding transcription activator (Camta)-like protein n=1 Tax=Sarcoptes scabiei TaxID=52283 RepID=A0A132ABF7_SARSC|nr:calmodulin-binding transcription activator (camta)-like protein [Sarcoptes scabiei]